MRKEGERFSQERIAWPAGATKPDFAEGCQLVQPMGGQHRVSADVIGLCQIWYGFRYCTVYCVLNPHGIIRVSHPIVVYCSELSSELSSDRKQ